MSGERTPEAAYRKIPRRLMRIGLKRVCDRAGLKQGDVVKVRISGEVTREVMTKVLSQGYITIPKTQLDKESLEKIAGKQAEIRVQEVPPAESTSLFKEGKIDLQEVTHRLGGYVARSEEGIKIGFEDGRGGIRTLTPPDSQMDIERFFENVGRNFADSDGAQGLDNMDPKMISEYVKYLEDMGLRDFGYRMEIASHHELSDLEKQEYLDQRTKLNPELPENAPVHTKEFEPSANPKRNPIGGVRVAKSSEPLRQIHEEAQKIIREAIDENFPPDVCEKVTQSFVQGAFGGDGGFDRSVEGPVVSYSESDPDQRALVRDAIKYGFGVSMNEYPQWGELRISNQEDVNELIRQGIGLSNAIRGGGMIAEQMPYAQGADLERLEEQLRELEPWLRPYINIVKEIDQCIPDSVVPKWRAFIRLLEEVLPPEDISMTFPKSSHRSS